MKLGEAQNSPLLLLTDALRALAHVFTPEIHERPRRRDEATCQREHPVDSKPDREAEIGERGGGSVAGLGHPACRANDVAQEYVRERTRRAARIERRDRMQ